MLPWSVSLPSFPTLVQVAAQAASSTAGGAGHEILEKSHLSLASWYQGHGGFLYTRYHGNPLETFIFRGYNLYKPYFGGVKPSFLMVFGSKGSRFLESFWTFKSRTLVPLSRKMEEVNFGENRGSDICYHWLKSSTTFFHWNENEDAVCWTTYDCRVD